MYDVHTAISQFYRTHRLDIEYFLYPAASFVDLNGRITVSGSPFIEAKQDRGGAAHDPFRPNDAMRSPSKPNDYLSLRRMP